MKYRVRIKAEAPEPFQEEFRQGQHTSIVFTPEWQEFPEEEVDRATFTYPFLEVEPVAEPAPKPSKKGA